MLKIIDNFLDTITMYRLVLYVLISWVVIAVFLSFFGLVPFSPVRIFYSTIFLVIVSWITNKIFSKVFEAPSNFESVYITALILALIITPAKSQAEFMFLFWAAVLSMASKYIVAINKKHIFNPAAFAVVLTAFFFNQAASWWVGNAAMSAFILIGGFLIVRKIRREDLVLAFVISNILIVSILTSLKGGDVIQTLDILLLHSAFLFFVLVMVIEPQTTPPTKKLRIIYGVIIGILFAPQIHLGNTYSTPELALVLGNIFSYLVSPKEKLVLKLKERNQIGKDLFDFVFEFPQKISFEPGQYMEWTLSHPKSDARGQRRYFTLASSPTEEELRLGVKFYENGSSFKKYLYELDKKTPVIASQLSGDFTLPKEANEKLVFIAGGIGITPFRSIIKYLIDTRQKRDIVLFYANKTADEIVYKDIFDEANKTLGLKAVYALTDKEGIPANWKGKIGRINENMIREEVPDYKERIFYLSGPHNMVVGFEEVLLNMEIKKDKIKKDFFPGYA